MLVLVTGGAGFIGSHLCDRLLADGHEVVALDNLLTGRRSNIAQLSGQPGFRFVEADVCDPLPADIQPQAVYHLASPASPVGYMQHPIKTLLTNSQGTLTALERARAAGASFLLASTSEVYGDPERHPQREDYWGNVNPVGPRACYDEGKRYAEALTINYQQVYDLDARIVRIFNTYGPRNDPNDGRIVPNFITQALRGEPITVYGDGQQTRSYCYVSDLVDGLVCAMNSPAARGEVVNLGTEYEQTVLAFAQLIRAIANSSSPIEHRPARAEEIARRRPDLGKARRLLGYEPRVPLAEGLARTIAWYREELQLGAQPG